MTESSDARLIELRTQKDQEKTSEEGLETLVRGQGSGQHRRPQPPKPSLPLAAATSAAIPEATAMTTLESGAHRRFTDFSLAVRRS